MQRLMTPRRIPLLGLLCWLCVGLAAAPGYAQNAATPPKARAGATAETPLDRLLAQSATALAASDFPAAYRALVSAYPLAPGLVVYHLGVLAAAENQPVRARDLFRRFQADLTVDAGEPLRLDAQARLAKLPLIEAGEVSVGAPRGTQVQVDGRLVGTVPLPTPILAQTGSHRVAVAQGRWRAEAEVQVRTARVVEVRFKSGSDVAVVTLPSAVLYCESYQGVSPADAEPLTQALESAVKRENYALLQRSAALEYARDEALCKNSADRPCCDQLARRYAVDYVLDVNIAREAENWNFDMALRDVQVEGAASQADLHCAGCNGVKAAARLAEIATQVLGQAAGKGRGTLAVSSTPSGAEVWLAGRQVGVTPYDHAVWAGTYALEVRRPGFRTQEQRVDIVADKPSQVAVELQGAQTEARTPQAGADAAASRRRKLIRIGAGAASIAAGAILIGFGAAALAANGQCAVDLSPSGLCTRAYSTTGIGAGLVATGGAFAVAGALVIAIPFTK